MTTIAGLDTATDDVSVAVVRDGEVVAERLVATPAGGHPRHSGALLAELEAVVTEGGGWKAIDFLAAGNGPGSFTGLRVGLATARAIAQALGKGIVPVGTLNALAGGIAESGSAAAHSILPVLDARRRQVFAALFDLDGKRRWEPLVASPQELAERVAALPESPLAAGRESPAASWSSCSPKQAMTRATPSRSGRRTKARSRCTSASASAAPVIGAATTTTTGRTP